jgi:S1-C subfamily serine protease
MGILDLAIIALCVWMALRWSQIGLVQGFFSLFGFLCGLVLGAILSPYVARLVDGEALRLFITIGIMVVAGSLLGTVGQQAGVNLSSRLEKGKFRKLDAVLGALFSVVLVTVYVWIASAVLSGSPFEMMNQAFQQSRIVQAVNKAYPVPPAALARIGSTLGSFEFPQVFIGPEPETVTPVAPPDSALLQQAVAVAGESTVRIEALGCGAVSRGSGFVAREDLVVTNAHVVAGADAISITDVSGKKRARLVYYDPDLDLAVLRVQGLAGEALPIADTVFVRGTPGAVLGYPGGGDFKANGAAILRTMNARGLNIYGSRTVSRQIYELQTQIVSGNSGGPVVTAEGRVLGVVFARSQTQRSIGYALTSTSILPGLNVATQTEAPVSSGRCTE